MAGFYSATPAWNLCAVDISTFLRSRGVCSKASVLAISKAEDRRPSRIVVGAISPFAPALVPFLDVFGLALLFVRKIRLVSAAACWNAAYEVWFWFHSGLLPMRLARHHCVRAVSYQPDAPLRPDADLRTPTL